MKENNTKLCIIKSNKVGGCSINEKVNKFYPLVFIASVLSNHHISVDLGWVETAPILKSNIILWSYTNKPFLMTHVCTDMKRMVT